MKKSTTGVHETSINFQGHLFRMVEVGGQKSERRKWIHCFEDLDSTIFMASLAEYDMNLVEDFSISRLRESIAQDSFGNRTFQKQENNTVTK